MKRNILPLSRFPSTAAALTIGGIIGALPLREGATLFGAVLVAGLVTLAPVAGLALTALGVPFGDLLRLGGGAGPAELGLALTAAVWGLRAASGRRFSFGGKLPASGAGRVAGGTAGATASAAAAPAGAWPGFGIWLPLGLVVASSVLSSAESQDLTQSLRETAKWVLLGLAVTMTAVFATHLRERLVLISVLLLAGTGEALHGLNQVSGGTGPLGFVLGGSMLRAFGHFGQPNPFAAHLGLTLILAAGVGLAFIVRTPGRPRVVPAIALAGCAAVLAAGIAASLSRGAWVGLAVAGVTMVAAHNPRSLLPIAAIAGLGTAVLLLTGLGWLPPVVATRLETLIQSVAWLDPQAVPLTSSNFAVVHRMAIWTAGWEMFLEHPWLGVGPGNFDLAYPLYAVPGWPQPPGHAHNFYLNLLAEAGVVGLLSYLALLGYMAAVSLRPFRAAKGGPAARTHVPPRGSWGETVNYGLALSGVGLVAMLAVFQVSDNLYVHSMSAQVGLIFGLAVSATTIPSRP